MNDNERHMLTVLGSAVETMSEMLAGLNARLEGLEGVARTMADPLASALAAGAASNVLAGMLLAELSDGDQARFDALMARTTNFAESKAGEVDGPARDALLRSLDTIVSVADEHFQNRAAM